MPLILAIILRHVTAWLGIGLPASAAQAAGEAIALRSGLPDMSKFPQF